MKTNYNEFTISARFDNSKAAIWDSANFNHNVVTVKNNDNGKRTTFDFWGSRVEPEVKTENDLLYVFYCFLSDAISGMSYFEAFCDDYGYDTDSRTAEKAWRACRRSWEKFFRLSGYSVDMTWGLFERLQEIVG